MRLRIKLGLGLLTGAALSLALVVNAALDMFDRELQALTASHFGFTVDEIAHSITVRTDLGLQLETIPEIAELLDRAQVADPDIDRLLVFGADNRVIFSTDPTDVGTTMRISSDEALWVEADERAVTVGSRLVNNFGKTVGGVLLESEIRHRAPLRERAAIAAFGIAVAVLLGSVALVFLLANWVLRPVLNMLRLYDTALLAMAEGNAVDMEDAPDSLAAFNKNATGLLADLDADTREIDRLDRIG